MKWDEYQRSTLILLAKRVRLIGSTVLMVFRISPSIFHHLVVLLVLLRTLSAHMSLSTLEWRLRLAKWIQTPCTFQILVSSWSTGIMWFSSNIIFVQREHYGSDEDGRSVSLVIRKSLALDEVEKWVGHYRYVSPKFYLQLRYSTVVRSKTMASFTTFRPVFLGISFDPK